MAPGRPGRGSSGWAWGRTARHSTSWTPPGRRRGRQARGIYRVEVDTLTMCLGAERPSQFSGAGAAALVELMRIV